MKKLYFENIKYMNLGMLRHIFAKKNSYDVLSPNTPNIILGDLNFVEEHIHMNRVGDQYFQNDRQVLPFWNEVKDDFDLTDSYRAVNPTNEKILFLY